jgi:SAM-dependent methyltransferase
MNATVTGWSHGYFSGGTYTSGFYRELAPNWLDFATLVKGLLPPRSREGDPFHYLELGSGMGFSLCLLAALYPEGTFLGVDFQPDHIAHSRALAQDLGLENLRFLEVDFLALRDDPTPLGLGPGAQGRFDYVVCHGTATWVTRPVQDALLAVAAAALRNGGIFYCSYNTLPGWQPLTLFQHLATLEAERCDPSLPRVPFERAAESLEALMGTEEQPTPLAMLFPSLRSELADLPQGELSYLCQEYANEGWLPLHVAELHRRAAAHKLSHCATATLPELFDDLLPEPLRQRVLQEENPLIRQTLLDLLSAKGFRRDLFSRGRVSLSQPQWEQRVGALTVRLAEAPPLRDYRFVTSFGEARGDQEAYGRLEAAIDGTPRRLEDLCVLSGLPLLELLRMVALLLDANRVGLDRGTAGQQAQQRCAEVNGRLQLRMWQGWPYSALTAPAIGNGVGFNIIEATLVHGQGQGLRGEALLATTLARLQSLGVALTDANRQPLLEPQEQRRKLEEMATTFARQRLPQLGGLGVLNPAEHRWSEGP